MSSTVLGTLHTLLHLLSTAIVLDKYHQCHLTDKKAEDQKGCV